MSSTTYVFSSCIGPIIERYFNLKRALGRQYDSVHNIFKHLDEYLKSKRSDITAESFTAWCLTQEHKSPTVRRNWMRNVRNLCLYRQRTEPSCFVPDLSQFPAPHQPIQPHIFAENEVIRLFEAVKELKPSCNSPLRCENCRLALVLLYTTGLRRGELIKLTIGDYDPKEHTLLIRESKFRKSRLIPLSEDGGYELERYIEIRRSRHFPASEASPLLWHNNRSVRNGFYTGTGLRQNLQALFRIADIHTVTGRLPRVHDFRHSFAVQALLRWYKNGEDVQARLPMLSIYMGHVSVVSTQYYLRFIEEVITSASDRFEAHYSRLITETCKGGAR